MVMSFLFHILVSTLILKVYSQPSCRYTFNGEDYQALDVCAELATDTTILHYKYVCNASKTAVERPVWTNADCAGSPALTLDMDPPEYQDFDCDLPICTDNIGVVRYHYSCPASNINYDDRIHITNYCASDRVWCCDGNTTTNNFYQYRFQTNDGLCAGNDFQSTDLSATPFSECAAGIYESISCNQTNQCLYQTPPPTPPPTYPPIAYTAPRPVVNYANIFGFGVPLNFCTSPNAAGDGGQFDALVTVPNCDGVDNIQYGRFWNLNTDCNGTYLMQWGVQSINTVANEGVCDSALALDNITSNGYAMMDITIGRDQCEEINASQRWPVLVNYCFFNGQYFRTVYCNDSLAVGVFYTDSGCTDFHSIEFMVGVDEGFGCDAAGKTDNYYVFDGVCTSDQIIPAQVFTYIEYDNGVNNNNPCDYMIADGIPWAVDIDNGNNGNGGTFCVNNKTNTQDHSFKLDCKTYQDSRGNTRTDIFSLNYNVLDCIDFRDSSIIRTDNFIDYQAKCGYGRCDAVGYMKVEAPYSGYLLVTAILTNVCVYNYKVEKRIKYRCDQDAAIIEYFDSFDCSGNPVQISAEWCLLGGVDSIQFLGCFNYDSNEIIQSNTACPQITSSPTSSPTDPTTSQPTTSEPTTSQPTTSQPTTTYPTPVAVIDDKSIQCKKNENYWIDGQQCSVNGDPHYKMWNSDEHDFMGIGSVSDQYYYVTRCHGVSVEEMPFSILATHKKCGSRSSSVRCLDYITIELWDKNSEYHLIWLNARTRQYKYAVNVEYTKAATLFGQTAENANDIETNSEYRISSRFTIKRPGFRYFILSVFGDKYSIPFSVRSSSVVIQPLEGFECLACGLCGSYKLASFQKEGYSYTLLPNCNSEKYSKITRGWRSSHKTAYSENGLSWKRYDVCDRSANPVANARRRRLAANSIEIEELAALPADFVFIDDCEADSEIETKARTECQNKRNEYTDICSQISDQCDELQSNCDYDACATADGNISAVRPAVNQMFGEILDIYRSDEVNITRLFDETRTIALPDSGVPEIYEPTTTTNTEPGVDDSQGVTFKMSIIAMTVGPVIYFILN